MGLDLASIGCLVVGTSRPRSLGADDTVGNGTYTLLNAAGSTVTTATVTAGACTVTLGGAVPVGARYLEVWAVTIGGQSQRITRPVMVAYSDFESAPIVEATITAITGLGAPAAGWGVAVSAAWSRVLLDLWQRWPAIRSADQMLDSPASLAQLCVYAAASQASVYAGTYTGGVARDWHEVWEARYRDGWRDLMLALDTDGNGVAETDPTRARPMSFPPQTPAAGR
jgi:hypothetical protein